MKHYDANIQSSYLMYWDLNYLYGWAMSQKLSVDGFKCRKDKVRSDEEFIKNYDEDSDNG